MLLRIILRRSLNALATTWWKARSDGTAGRLAGGARQNVTSAPSTPGTGKYLCRGMRSLRRQGGVHRDTSAARLPTAGAGERALPRGAPPSHEHKHTQNTHARTPHLYLGLL